MVILREIFDATKFAALLVAVGWLCGRIAQTPLYQALQAYLLPGRYDR